MSASINPAFDVYRVSDTFPTLCTSAPALPAPPLRADHALGSVIGFPESTQKFVYFNRTDVQDAIHAPHIAWETCSDGSVYASATGGPGRDTSVASTLSVLPNVIEKSVRTVIVHGLAVRRCACAWRRTGADDGVGRTLSSLLRGHVSRSSESCAAGCGSGADVRRRNMTWNGLQGFQTPIEEDSFVVDNMGTFGNMHQERGLTCASFPSSAPPYMEVDACVQLSSLTTVDI